MGWLKDKVIIVAGAGGIGDGLAARYAAEGAAVVLGDLDGDRALEVAAEIDPSGERVVGVMLDGSDDHSIGDMVALTLSKFGALHGFHANFCYFGDETSPLCLETDMATHDEMVRVNMRGYLLCARHAVPAMIASGGGSILFTSSGSASQGSGTYMSYGMVKAATHALMRNIAARYGPQGIRANVIAPGVILHPGLAAKMPVKTREAIRSTMAIKSRFGTAEDIAAMGAFLLSDDAGYITGQIMAVDGGITMRP